MTKKQNPENYSLFSAQDTHTKHDSRLTAHPPQNQRASGSRLIIHVDGAARGNPGPAAAGGLIEDGSGKVLAKICKYLGETTNNQAEYRALLLALEKAHELKAVEVIIYSDSELMVKQIKREYKVKNEGLKPLFEEAQKLLRKFGRFEIHHVLREKNKEADELANLAIDSQDR